MTGSIAWHIFNGIMAVAWVAFIVSWVMRGCPIPCWLHVFAGCLLFAGLAVVVILGIKNRLTLKLGISCVLVPPGAAYIGWLWMFGPGATKSETQRDTEQSPAGGVPKATPEE